MGHSENKIKYDSPSHLDMDESSEDGRHDENLKKYITFDKEQNSDNNKNNKIDKAEDSSMTESINKSNEDIDQYRQRVMYGKKWKRKKMIAFAKKISKNHEGKERNFDGQSSIQIDPHENNEEREDIQSNENRKH